MAARAARLVALGAAIAATAVSCGSGRPAQTWSLPGQNLAGARAAPNSAINRRNVRDLHARWRFHLPTRPSFSGTFASTPVTDGKTVFVQDLRSNVYALDLAGGRVRWQHRFGARNDGPNGLAVAGGRIFGATDTNAFALSATTGRTLWSHVLVRHSEQFVDIAPVVWHGLVFVSTVGYVPFGRGAIYALDAATGKLAWRFVTIARPWPHPFAAGGGGLWYPVSVDRAGRLYAGNSNPTPWGGSPTRPNGAVYPGPVPFTDSLIVLDASTGRLLWTDQVTPHDVRDYDFQATPVLVGRSVVGAGKAGLVISWNTRTHGRAWVTRVGLHRHDTGPLPRRPVTVCPGLLGGVETPMAAASGRIFVPVVDLCWRESAVSQARVDAVDPRRGRGRFVALDAADGRIIWQRRFASPDFGCAAVANGVVFTSTYDGTVYALSTLTGATLWHARLPAGINACPMLTGDMVVIGAGIPDERGRPEIVAFSVERVA